MNNFGTYYKKIKKNYIEMKKYYLMAIELSHPKTIDMIEDLEKYESIINETIINSFEKTNIIEDCIVCYENKMTYFLNCKKHSLCFNCLLKLHTKPCPMCRHI